MLELDLSWNCFLEYGTTYLSSALAQSRCLKVLEMHSSEIHTAGAFKIADVLKKNQSLEVLRIGKNPSKDQELYTSPFGSSSSTMLCLTWNGRKKSPLLFLLGVASELPVQ